MSAELGVNPAFTNGPGNNNTPRDVSLAREEATARGERGGGVAGYERCNWNLSERSLGDVK